MSVQPPAAAADAPIAGHCDPRFGAVRDAFAANFAERGEIGAALCIRIGDATVVDLWGGFRDAARREPWQHDTLVNAYSVGKALTAMAALQLVERGALDLDAPVARRWPAFAAAGKERVTLRALLAHRAGLPGVAAPLAPDAMLHWDTMTAALAAQAPWWEPDTAHGYHTNSFGHLVGELVCRASGLRFGEAFARGIAGRAEGEYHMGLARRHHARVAPILAPAMRAPDDPEALLRSMEGGDPARDALLRAAYFNPPGLAGIGCVNTAAWREAVIPSTNGHGTARGVAAIYAAWLGGRLAVGPGLRAEAARVHSEGPDRVLGRPSRFGLGLQLSAPDRPIGRSEAAFGHYGYGGTLGFADPDADIAFGYLMNLPGDRWRTPRTNALVDALYACL